MKTLILLGAALCVPTLASAQSQIGVASASGSPTTSSPGFVYNNPPFAVQNFLYDGEYINYYGFGFHDYNDGTSIGGINGYLSTYFGLDVFTGGQQRFRINTNGNAIFTQSVAMGRRNNGTSGEFEALSVHNTTATNLSQGNAAVIQFYNNSNNVATVKGASIKSVSANSQYGWESDLYLRTTKNNGYDLGQHQVLNAIVIKGGSGNVGIGTTSPNERLTVNGVIYGKEVRVDLNVPGPDYVFDKEYSLPAIADLKQYIEQNKHLPDVPSAEEMATEGIKLGEMNMLLLKKVEELTLYLIGQSQETEALRLEIERLQESQVKLNTTIQNQSARIAELEMN